MSESLVVALVPDLMFGSKVVATVEGAGHECVQCPNSTIVCARINEAALLIVDLSDDVSARLGLVSSLRNQGQLDGCKTLALYSHVEAKTKQKALAAGIDLVVPRSRFVREGDALIADLLAE